MKKRRFLPIPLYLIILVVLFSVVTAIFGNRIDDLSYSQVIDRFRAEQVKSFVVEENTITLELHTPYEGKNKLTCNMADPASFRAEMQEIFAQQTESGVLESYDFIPESKSSPYDWILPMLIVGLLFLVLAIGFTVIFLILDS